MGDSLLTRIRSHFSVSRLIMLAAARAQQSVARIRFDLSPCSRALIVTGGEGDEGGGQRNREAGRRSSQARTLRLFCFVRTTVTCVHAETRQSREFPTDVIKISLEPVRVSATVIRTDFSATAASLLLHSQQTVPPDAAIRRVCERLIERSRRGRTSFHCWTCRNSSCGWLVCRDDEFMKRFSRRVRASEREGLKGDL